MRGDATEYINAVEILRGSPDGKRGAEGVGSRQWEFRACQKNDPEIDGKKSEQREEGENMRFIWLVLAILLFFAWVGSFAMYHIAGFMIHLLLIFAVISLILHLFTARRSV
jgi:hypothetical protein